MRVRTGVVLDRAGGALAKMLMPLQLGIGGPVAGGRQYLPWVHADDVVGIFSSALGEAPSARMTATRISSSPISAATGIAATSWTPGWARTTRSISAPEMFSPRRRIMSFLRLWK